MELLHGNGNGQEKKPPIEIELSVLDNPFDLFLTFTCPDHTTGISAVHEWMKGKKVFVTQLTFTPMMKPHPLMQGQGTVFFHFLVVLRKEQDFHLSMIDTVGKMATDIGELKKALAVLGK